MVGDDGIDEEVLGFDDGGMVVVPSGSVVAAAVERGFG